MDYNDTHIYEYFFKKDENIGYKVYHFENGQETWDYSFLHEEDAEKFAKNLNLDEAYRVSSTKERLERVRNNVVKIEDPHHFSLTGYYGD